jgi:hypothetical protein
MRANFGSGVSDGTTIRRHTAGFTPRSVNLSVCTVGSNGSTTPPPWFSCEFYAARIQRQVDSSTPLEQRMAKVMLFQS